MVTMPGQPIESYSPEGEEMTRAITAREPAPYKPDMGLQVKPKAADANIFGQNLDDPNRRLAQRAESGRPGWKERFIGNVNNLYRYDGQGMADLKDIQDAAQERDILINGQGGVYQQTAEDAQADAETLRERRREEIASYENMPLSETPAEWSAAIAGNIYGMVTSPSSLIPVGKITSIGSTGWRAIHPYISRMLDSSVSNAAMNAALNATIQAEEFGADVREDVDWLSLGLDTGLGALFGVPFGAIDGAAAARQPQPRPAPPPGGQAPMAPRPQRAEPAPPEGMGIPTPEQMQAEYSAQDLAQAQEDLFGEVIGTRNLTPEQAAQLDDYLNAGRADDIPQAEPETEGGLTNEAPPTSVRDAFLEADETPPADTPETPPEAPAEAPRQAPPPPLPIDRTERQFLPSELKVDAKRFQFKDGGDDAGVTDRLKGVKKWDPIKSGVTLVWEDLNGDFYIADGHQRHGLASRLEKEGQEPKIRAVVLREADGVTSEDARAIAAAKNIAEGTGNAVDAAKILRSRPDMGVDLPPTSALVRDAQGLATLSDDAFGMVINKKVPAGYAAQVGRLAPDPKTHAELLGLLAKEQPDNAIEAESMIRDALEAPAVQSTMEDMFGSAEVTQILFKERAQVLSAAATAIRKDRAAFATLVREEARLTGAGNQLATQTNAERAAQDAEILATLQAQARRKGPIADALAAAAKRLKDGDSRQIVVRDFLNELRRSGEAASPDGRGAGAAGREGQEGIAARLGGYRDTDQPAFRKWFGDSKVVDENGDPLVVYHGGPKGIDAFDLGKAGNQTGATNATLGIFLTSDDAQAELYAGRRGEIYELYAAINNPFVIRSKEFEIDASAAVNDATAEHVGKKVSELEQADFQEWRDWLKSRGHDGIEVELDNGLFNFIAFEPTQIKSIFNRGTWDASEPNIAFSRRRPAQEGPSLFDVAPAPEFKARIDEMRVTKQGMPPEKTFTYAAKYRPPGYATVPPGYVSIGAPTKEHPFGTVTYDKPIAFKDEDAFELTPLDPNNPRNIAKARDAFIDEFRTKFEQAGEQYTAETTIQDVRGKTITKTIIVTPSVRKGVDWQLTYLDDGEASGHLDFTDFDELATEVWRLSKQGYTEPGAAPPPRTETGADNRPQLVIPGAEKIGDKRLAEMRAKAPLKASRAQKQMDIGLFSDDADQQGFAFRDEMIGTGLPDLIANQAPIEEIANHPFVLDAVRRMAAVPLTHKQPGYMSPEWKAQRTYSFKDGEVVGYDNAITRLTEDAKAFSTNGPVKAERVVTILLGPPAAGKSTHAEKIAAARFAAIVDPDEAKNVIPEFDGGIGANAVHEESAEMAADVLYRLTKEGTNMVIPKVGGSEEGIRKLVLSMKRQGYRVNLVSMNVTYENAFRRMIGRFMSKGRLINPEYVAEVGIKPTSTYRKLREEGIADGYAEIDGNGGLGQIPKLLDDTGALDGVPGYGRGRGGDGDLSPQAGTTRAGAEGRGQDVDPLTQPGGEWRNADVMATDEAGKAIQINAGDAVDFMVTRINALRQLLECVNAG